MKYFKIIFSLLVIGLLYTSCQDDDLGLDTILVPTNIVVNTEISDDGSGEVSFQATANNALSYKYIYSDGTSAVSLGGDITKRFTSVGLNTYLVTVVAYGKGGVSSSKSIEVEVRSDFNDPETKQLLTGGSSKTWYIASAVPGHLGVGQNVNDDGPIVDGGGFFSGPPNFGPECFYDDEMTFSLNENDDILYEYENFGVTFFNRVFTSQFGGNGEEDQCLDFTSTETVPLSLVPASSGIDEQRSTGTVLSIADDGFISYYIGQSQYEVLSITENKMSLRAVQGNDNFLVWYLILTTSPDGTVGDGGEEEEAFVSEFTNLVFSDEFDGDDLDTDIWNYEIGNGTNGWGNGEAQFYTEDNVKVQDGNLVITARREAESGFDFTSGRITTQDNYDFTFGRVEARAKLPEGGGTWPAIWMLGANFDVVGWPETGEIDIMEWIGNNPDEISSALHFPGNSGGNPVYGTTPVQNATSVFHTYAVEWTQDNIIFLLDGDEFFTFTNDASLPFNKDFFLIMNVAMGGVFGGDIDPAFQESSMEVDYIRVYQ
jgi:hypothetical protein